MKNESPLGRKFIFNSENYLKSLFFDKRKVLKGANCSGFDLDGENFKGKNLKGINFLEASLRKVNFEGANLEGANLQFANLDGANLKNANLRNASVDNASFVAANLQRANISGVIINSNNFKRAKLNGISFKDVQIFNTKFQKAIFEDSVLIGTNFISSNIDGAKFERADLSNLIVSEKQLNFLPKKLIEKYKDTITIPTPLNTDDTETKETIVRSIEFPPEYKQAGISILNYFSDILNQKYPDKKVKIKISQEQLKITMAIETEDGQKDIIERELENYGLVVSGELSPDKYCSNSIEAMALKQKLEMAALEVKHTKELLYTERNQYEKRILTLEDIVHSMLQSNSTKPSNDINISFSNVGSPSITDNSSHDVNIKQETVLKKRDKSQLIELTCFIEKNLQEFKVGKRNEEKLGDLITIIKKDLKKEKSSFFSLKDNLNSVNDLLQGATGSLIASGLLPQIQNILSNIFG